MPYKLQIAITDRVEKEFGITWEQNYAVGWIKIEKGQGGFSFILAKSTTFVKSKNHQDIL